MNSRSATPRLLFFVVPLGLLLGLLSAAHWALLADDSPVASAGPLPSSIATIDGQPIVGASTQPQATVAGGDAVVKQPNEGKQPTSLVIGDADLKDLAAKEAAAEAAAASGKLISLSKTTPASLADLMLLQNAIEQAEQKALPATVGIRILDTFGSGIVVTEDGYVLTAGHVIGRPDIDATIIFPDGKKVKAKTRGVNRDMDSGLLKITDEGKYPHVEMGNSSDIKLGQWLIALGHPLGLMPGRPPVLRIGRVLYSRNDAIQTDGTITAGDSGGPLLDLAGRVVGIHSRISDDIHDNYHVPIDTYRQTWDRLVKGDSWGIPIPTGPVLGIDGQDVAEGCKVTDVYSRYPAAKAGIKVGDVIVGFDGKPVAGMKSLHAILDTRKPDDDVTITVLRGEEKLEFKATLAERQY